MEVVTTMVNAAMVGGYRDRFKEDRFLRLRLSGFEFLDRMGELCQNVNKNRLLQLQLWRQWSMSICSGVHPTMLGASHTRLSRQVVSITGQYIISLAAALRLS